MKKPNKFIIKVLDDFRKQGIMEEKDMLNKIGISYETWRRIKANNNISVRTLKMISDATNVPMLEYYELLEEISED